jgi:phosphate transport system protein
MPRDYYQMELRQLRDDLLIMASKVYQQMTDASAALHSANLDEARRIIAQDAEINRARYYLEDATLTIIATQQPMASDMRFLAGTLEIISELERIGDYAKGLARITLSLGRDPGVTVPTTLDEMITIALQMLRGAVDAFISADESSARAIPAQDENVDRLYNQTNVDLIRLVMAEPSKMARANLFSWAAHNIERTADRAINICERTIYMVTGRLYEFDSPEEEYSGIN